VYIDDVKLGWEQWVLLSSDEHHDNIHCDHALEKKHLDEALKRDALIVKYGDLFCAMQGKWDKRADESQMRPELRGANYLDRLVNYNADFYKPYAKNFALVAPGNHEGSILKHHQTNLTERFVQILNTMRPVDNPIYIGGFSGWMRFMFTVHGTQRLSKRLYYHHGYGGDAPVTKGTIQTNRMSVYLPDADIVCTGHTHNEWIFPIERLRLSNSGVIYKDTQLHIKTPGYKDEFADGSEGWHIERGGPPKPTGAVWLRFYYGESEASTGKVKVQAIMAD